MNKLVSGCVVVLTAIEVVRTGIEIYHNKKVSNCIADLKKKMFGEGKAPEPAEAASAE